MKLFLSQTMALNSENPQDHFSKVLEIFATYIRAPHRNTVEIILVSKSELESLGIDQLPMLISEQNRKSVQNAHHISIMQEIAKSVYLSEVLFGKKDSQERMKTCSFIETTDRMEVDELVTFVNGHLETRMFLVGQSISAADIVVHAKIAESVRILTDYNKMQIPNAFRWIDHI